jgi:predicted enzyme related to lactoylglutathione lyase
LSNDFSWHELGTTDPEAALKFYGELCGWENTAKHDMGPNMGFYYLVGMKGVEFAGAFKSPAERGAPAWLSYAHVADIDKATNAAKAGGAKISHGPMQVPGGTWITVLTDPQGAQVALHADKRVTAAVAPAAPAKPGASAKPVAPAQSAAPAAAKPPAAAVKAPTSSPTAGAAPASKAPAPAPTSAKKAPLPQKKAAPAKQQPSAKKKKKAPAKKAAAKKRAAKKPKSAARSARKKVAVKRKAVKKRKVARGRGAKKKSGFEVAKRFAAKQADSLLKRLRGKKHR